MIATFFYMLFAKTSSTPLALFPRFLHSLLHYGKTPHLQLMKTTRTCFMMIVSNNFKNYYSSASDMSVNSTKRTLEEFEYGDAYIASLTAISSLQFILPSLLFKILATQYPIVHIEVYKMYRTQATAPKLTNN